MSNFLCSLILEGSISHLTSFLYSLLIEGSISHLKTLSGEMMIMINKISGRNHEYESWFRLASLGWWNEKCLSLQRLLPNQGRPFWRHHHWYTLELLENGMSDPNLPLWTSLAPWSVPRSMALSVPKFCLLRIPH